MLSVVELNPKLLYNQCMINSAQSIEGARFTPEKKLPINFEHISSTSHKSAITKVEEKLDQEKILDPINDESTVGSEQMQTVSQTQSPVSVQKFVLEVRNIFTKFVVELSQFAAPTKNAQELT